MLSAIFLNLTSLGLSNTAGSKATLRTSWRGMPLRLSPLQLEWWSVLPLRTILVS